MKTVIIGAGNVGRNLARKLCDERYDVVLVDISPEALARAGDQMDVMTVTGNGADPRVLLRAGVEGADLLAAVTGRDEINILACICARAAGVRHKVARLSNAAMLSGGLDLRLSDLGVDYAVSPNPECAREIASLIRIPGAVEVLDLFEGRAAIIGLRVSSESPLLSAPLKHYPDKDFLRRFRLIALRRGDRLLGPAGDTQLMIGDEIYLAAPAEELAACADVVMPDRPHIGRVIIAGGGGLGSCLARQLEQVGLATVILEADRQIAEACSSELEKTLVLRNDGVTAEVLEEAGAGADTAFIATTDDDELNIISCLLAQKQGVSLTIAQVTKPEYIPMIENLSLLDRAVSTHLSVVNAVLRFVRGRHVRSAALLQTLPGELIEFVLRPDHPLQGKPIQDIGLPRGSVVAVVARGGEVVVPTGDLMLQAGDRLAMFALPEAVGRLTALLRT